MRKFFIKNPSRILCSTPYIWSANDRKAVSLIALSNLHLAKDMALSATSNNSTGISKKLLYDFEIKYNVMIFMVNYHWNQVLLRDKSSIFTYITLLKIKRLSKGYYFLVFVAYVVEKEIQ